jgi:hypothetical protein
VLGDTDAFVYGPGGTIEQVFSKSIAGSTLTVSLSAAQTSALGPGANVWALRVGTQFWIGGRLDLDLPGEDLDPNVYDNAVTLAISPVNVTISLPVQGAPAGVTAHGSTHATGGSDVLTLALSQISGLQGFLDAKQPLDSDLTDIAALTPANDQIIQRKSNVWTVRTPSQLAVDMGLVPSSVAGFDEQVRDVIGSALVAGSGMTITVNDAGDTITLSSTGGGGGITAEDAVDAVAAQLVAGAGMTIVYNDIGNTITFTATGGGGGITTEDAVDAVAAALVPGSGMTITYNDAANTITLSSSGGGGGTSGLTWINAASYGLSRTASASVNTAAVQSAIAAAASAMVPVFFPACGGGVGSYYMINPGAFTPAPGGNLKGLEYIGEGEFLTVFQMSTQSTAKYFYDNIGAPTTLSMANFRDIGWVGGPTDTPTQRQTVNTNHNGFRLQGQTDQSFRFLRCRFATMNTAFHTIGNNNADVSVWIDCRFMHIAGNVLLVDNQQTVNMNFHDCAMDIIWGNVIHSINSDGLGGGGALNIFGGHIIVQRDGANRGCLVKLDYIVSSTITITGVRCEVRNDAIAVDGSVNAGQATVSFHGSTLYTTESTGSVRLVDIYNDQSVNFVGGCTFESNGADQNYRVQGSGLLQFIGCGCRSNVVSTVSVTNPGTGAQNGTARWLACWARFAQGTRIETEL